MAQYTIRVPDDLDESVSAAAAADERSKNGEIIWLLKAGLKARAHRVREMRVEDEGLLLTETEETER